METKLTERKVRSLIPGAKPYKIFDGGGLFLLVTPAGGRLWRFKFRIAGREKQLCLGKWPDLSLEDARRLHSEARHLLALGGDPAAEKRRQKIQAASAKPKTCVTFRNLSEDWLVRHAHRVSSKRIRTLERTLQKRCFPFIGGESVADLTPPTLLNWLHHLEDLGMGPATVHLCKSSAKMVLDYGVASGVISSNPLENRGLGRQLAPVRCQHLPAPDRPETVGKILACLREENLPAHWQVQAKAALRLLPYVVTRPSEMLGMRWKDVDFDSGEWRFVASKVGAPLIVPLSRQALDILRSLVPVTGGADWVFQDARHKGRHLEPKRFPALLAQVPGIVSGTIVPHGWRSVFATLGQEELGFSLSWIELQLGHRVKGPLGDTYNRAQFLADRRGMMQRWADYLDDLAERSGGGRDWGRPDA